jgi:magnesium transporter
VSGGRALDDIWVRLRADDREALARARAAHRVDFPSGSVGMVGEDDDYFYVPLVLVTPAGEDALREDQITIALGDERVFTLQSGADFPPFDRALGRLRRFPEYAEGPKSVLRTLLEGMNEASEEVIWVASAALEVLNREIEGITLDTEGQGGRVFSAADINETMAALNEQETPPATCASRWTPCSATSRA